MTKEEIIFKVAEEEFISNGYLSTSMVTVAKRAGVTHAMVNYYFRSKEQLFLKILDSHISRFAVSLREAMHEDEVFLQNIVNAADALFKSLNADRDFLFLIQDVIRTSPELLDRYSEGVHNAVKSVLDEHSSRLQSDIEAGRIKPATMPEILETIFALVASPFLMIPALENLCRFSEEMIDGYLERRRKETIEIIKLQENELNEDSLPGFRQAVCICQGQELLLVLETKVLNIDGLLLSDTLADRRLLEVLAGTQLANRSGLLELSLKLLKSLLDIVTFLNWYDNHP